MRLILFLNNWGGWQVARWLRKQSEDIVGVVVQPVTDQRFAREILAELDMPSDRIWTAPELRSQATLLSIRELRPDLGISVYFGYVLKPELLEIPSHGCINLHTAYLPWNRGWHTNVWPIIDGSPAGISIHYMDKGIDTGDIVAQRRISVDATETGGSLHQKLNYGMLTLFKQTWPLIKTGQHARTPQNHAAATIHRRADLAAIDEIHFQQHYRARDLINLLRARTYPPYPSAFFVEGGRRTYVRVQLEGQNDDNVGSPPGSITDEADSIHLDRGYIAAELLRILSDPPGGRQFAQFVDVWRRVNIRAEFVNEEEIDPDATPSWTASADA